MPNPYSGLTGAGFRPNSHRHRFDQSNIHPMSQASVGHHLGIQAYDPCADNPMIQCQPECGMFSTFSPWSHTSLSNSGLAQLSLGHWETLDRNPELRGGDVAAREGYHSSSKTCLPHGHEARENGRDWSPKSTSRTCSYSLSILHQPVLKGSGTHNGTISQGLG